jgi:hypothetical protein
MYETPADVSGRALSTNEIDVEAYIFFGRGTSTTTRAFNLAAYTKVRLTGNVRFCTKGKNVEVLVGVKITPQNNTEYFVSPLALSER